MPTIPGTIEYIRELIEERKDWSDAAILDELAQVPVLPDESDPVWNNLDKGTWRNASRYLALADISAERKLYPATSLLLERACYGDPGEIMRGLRHRLERIVTPNWNELAEECARATKFPQPGARLWSVDELGVIRDANFIVPVIEALDDSAQKVRMQACNSLAMICQTNPPSRKDAVTAIRHYRQRVDDVEERRSAAEILKDDFDALD